MSYLLTIDELVEYNGYMVNGELAFDPEDLLNKYLPFTVGWIWCIVDVPKGNIMLSADGVVEIHNSEKNMQYTCAGLDIPYLHVLSSKGKRLAKLLMKRKRV